MLEAKRKAAIGGKDPQAEDVKPETIRDVLGATAITPDGYLSETVTLKPFMNPENGTGIYELVGTGFNSDCKTCDNYYSIRFDDFSRRHRSNKYNS